MRKKFHRSVYANIRFRQDHKCACGCGEFLMPGDDVEFNHVLALFEGGPDTPDNLEAVKRDHHKKITARQAAARGKVRRIRAKRAGAGNAKDRALARRSAWEKMP